MNPVQQQPIATALFPILQKLFLHKLPNLGEICHDPVPAGSFGLLTKIHISNCERLENLFQQPFVGCPTQLKHLAIVHCVLFEEVIWKEK